MSNHPSPAYSLICDNLPETKFREVLDELGPKHTLSAFILGYSSEENISFIIILTDSVEDAQNFAKALGQRATPEPTTMPDPDES